MSEGEVVARDPRLPRYPVIAKDPEWNDIRGNYSGSDYMKWWGTTAVSLPTGYVFGMRLAPRVAVPSMVVTGFLGAVGGYLWAFQSSSFRLQGFAPNDREVRKYIPADE